MSASAPFQSVYRIADLSQSRPTAFSLVPDSADMKTISDMLGLSGLRKLRFVGEINAQGKSDWRIDAQLGATVVQPCVVTLEPVSTRIDQPVTRLYLAAYEEPEGSEVEMLEDDTVEPLPREIDLSAVMIEALALHIPTYPRASDAGLDQTVFTEPGKSPLTDDDVRPFAGLAALRGKLGDGE